MVAPERTLEEMRSLFEIICDEMTDGLSTRKACVKHGVKPSTFCLWKAKYFNSPEDCERYTRARDLMADAIVDEMFNIADTPCDKDEYGSTDKGMVEQTKLRAQMRQWYVSKIARKYSEKAHDDAPQSSDKTVTITFTEAKP